MKAGVKPNVFTYSTLIDMLREVIDVAMPKAGVKPNVVTYNTLIDMLRMEGDDDAAKNVVEEMKKAKVQPDEYTKYILNSPARGEDLSSMRTEQVVLAFEARRRRGDCCSTIYDGQDGGEWRGGRASFQCDAQNLHEQQ